MKTKGKNKAPRAGQASRKPGAAPRGRAPGKVAAHAKALVAGDCCADCAGKSILAPKDRRVLRHLRTLGSAHAKGALKSSFVLTMKHAGKPGAKKKPAATAETSVKSGAAFYTALGLGEFADDVRGLEGLGDQEVFDVDAEDFDDSGLGDISFDKTVMTADQVARAAAEFDVQLNAWLLDYQQQFTKMPASLTTQIDAFVLRWRDIKNGFYIFETNRITDIVDAMALWNKLKDQAESYGVWSAVGAATVTVAGKDVDARNAPRDTGLSGLLGSAESIIKWGAIGIGGLVVLKVSSDLGLFKGLAHAR